MTQDFYLKCSRCNKEATLTSTQEKADALLSRRPSWCGCADPGCSKMIPGKLKA